MADLTEEQVKEFEDAFKVYDKDKDGRMNLKELRSAMRALALNPTEDELQHRMNEIDSDSIGSITKEEFLTLMSRKLKGYDAEEELKEAFKVFDEGQNGHITVKELRDVMSNLGEMLTDEEVKVMIEEASPDEAGMINYHDFIKVILDIGVNATEQTSLKVRLPGD